MYSVIIQTKETMEAFSTYRPLFMEGINNKTVGFCVWNDEETNIDDALPGLKELTDDKKEWRAIIVRLENEQHSKFLPKSEINPYDFFDSNEAENKLEESQVPLIRLTHMLGGVPPIEKEFKSILIEEENMAPRLAYEPIEDEESDNAFKELQKKYEFDGISPTSIIIITIREPWQKSDNLSINWKDRKENQSSEFWKRNRYPSICRFIVFDVTKQGPVKREEELFKFWLTVLLLSTNKIDSATLQGYRLYRTDISIDQDIMSDVFQQTVNRLSSTKFAIKVALGQQNKGIGMLDGFHPDYTLDIPVVFDVPKNAKNSVNLRRFRIISPSPSADINVWNEEQKQVESSFIKSVKIADRALDQTANRMKDSYTIEEDEVIRLDKYQIEDMVNETEELYSDIVELQGILPTDKITIDNSVKDIKQKVYKFLRGRVTISPIIITLAFILLIAILMQFPLIIGHANGEIVSWKYAIAEVISIFAMVFSCSTITLLFQKKSLTSLIKEYNKTMKDAFLRLENSARDYSHYLSAVVSHSRGKSYLSAAQKKKEKTTNKRNMYYKHMGAIDLFLSRMQIWSKSYHLDVNFQRPVIYDGAMIDVLVPPTESIAYTLETGQNKPVQLNKSGMFINSPYSFISKFELVREELYDDVN